MTISLISIISSARPVDIALLSLFTFILLKAISTTRKRVATTKLKGPPSDSLLYGVARTIEDAEDSAVVYETWERAYGAVYRAPFPLGLHRIFLGDPRALAHMWARDTTAYATPLGIRKMLMGIMGKGLLYSHGEEHRRQRKALSPAFSHSALRKLTHIFYDSTYKVTNSWNDILEKSGDGTIVEVQRWMGFIALDSIGLGGFSHDFKATSDPSHTSETAAIFHAIGENPGKYIYRLLMMLSYPFPWAMDLPIEQNELGWRLNKVMAEIVKPLFEKAKAEKESVEEKSAIGLLIKAEAANPASRLTEQEIIDEMRTLLFAGYETSSISLSWALVELSKDQDNQRKLRQELEQFNGTDPSYDDLTNGLPILDAVVHEVLRLHPPLPEVTRVVCSLSRYLLALPAALNLCFLLIQALQDDIIPLGEPIVDASGNTISNVTVAKGTLVTTSMQYLNRSEKFWGPDAKEFKPERWLQEGGPQYKARELQGHRHLWTFNEGPRTCLGKNFALAEFKAALSVLVRNFAFELRSPKDRVVTSADNVVRPKIFGEHGVDVPLRVSRLH
ncbi:cytochrome P450 [Coniophora puteana RWD-64-598 SS2]|uniref:Cytochrome P450 n=1 Tax=Coniophora puteana (strain RWD-64-598) TaxID=741705 RepID=A0A5M3MI11_CONPW|nr:cytochrome P450 [Coniophora puteana RWD-64-598 SS2]EIW78646.1 cytochrome P450 [Coniophora puteana RWD-64-598 SS2]